MIQATFNQRDLFCTASLPHTSIERVMQLKNKQYLFRKGNAYQFKMIKSIRPLFLTSNKSSQSL